MEPRIRLAIFLLASGLLASGCDDDPAQYEMKLKACREVCAADHRVMKSAGKDGCTCDSPAPAPPPSASAAP